MTFHAIPPKKTCWLIYSSFVFQGCKLNIWIVWCWIVHCRCPVALRGFGCCWYCHRGQSDESPWVCNGSNISNTIPWGLKNGSWKNGFVIWIRVIYVIFRRFRCKSLRFLIDRSLLEWCCFCLDLHKIVFVLRCFSKKDIVDSATATLRTRGGWPFNRLKGVKMTWLQT